MNPSKRFLALAGFVGLALIGLHAGTATSEDKPAPVVPAPQPRLDRGKTVLIEPAIAGVLQNAAIVRQAKPNPPRVDFGKSIRIEPGLQQFIQAASQQALIDAQVKAVKQPAPPAEKDFVNPKVEPGKVRWHATIQDAQAAALKSKRPVLVFQMMGKLDDQFC